MGAAGFMTGKNPSLGPECSLDVANGATPMSLGGEKTAGGDRGHVAPDN